VVNYQKLLIFQHIVFHFDQSSLRSKNYKSVKV